MQLDRQTALVTQIGAMSQVEELCKVHTQHTPTQLTRTLPTLIVHMGMVLTHMGLTHMEHTRMELTHMGLTHMEHTRMELTHMGLTHMGLTHTVLTLMQTTLAVMLI